MSTRIACGLAACLVLPLLTGCSNSQGIVRGQAPSGYPAHQPSSFRTASSLMDAVYPDQSVSYGDQCNNCQQCPNCNSNQCSPSGCSRCGFGCGHCPHGGDWYPTHYHFFHYDAPRGGHHAGGDELVYPQANTPAAVVQYPYYTTKGPDDFFLN